MGSSVAFFSKTEVTDLVRAKYGEKSKAPEDRPLGRMPNASLFSSTRERLQAVSWFERSGHFVWFSFHIRVRLFDSFELAAAGLLRTLCMRLRSICIERRRT